MQSPLLSPTTLHWASWKCDGSAQAVDLIQEAAACLSPPSGPWWIVQGFAGLLFASGGASPQDISASFAGRAFSPQGEIRWACDGSRWQLWAFTESCPALLASMRKAPLYRQNTCRCRDVPHVLWGLWDAGRQVFDEPQMGRAHPYPIAGGTNEDRAAILVREYLPVPVSASDDCTLVEVLQRLNAPEVAAHRFLKAQVGSTSRWAPAAHPAPGESE